MNKRASTPITPTFPTWLIRSKVHPTRQKVDILDRPSLVNKLANFQGLILSLVHAPAGYGKSTLLSAWRNQLIEGGAKVCWLSLDKEDNEVFQLLTYIAFSLSEGGADFHKAGVTSQSLFKESSPQSLIGMINHVIEAQTEQVVLIFDDFENLDQNTVNSVIKPLLDYAPDNLHIAIASRDDRKLKITNLETQGLVTRIQAKSLCFTLNELVAFFAGQIPTSTIKHIFQVTEGWPVTVQMLKNSGDIDMNVKRLLDNFSGSSNLITNYLSEQIFLNLNEQMQCFLMDISLLDRISCEFANYLRTSNDSIAQFEACSPLSTLVLPVDQVEQTFRLHPLFREYLHERLLIEHPSRANKLHKQTASWFSERGDIVKAVKHSLLASEPAQAIQIVEDHGGIIIWLREGLTRLRAVLKLMDRETIESAPRIRVIRCLVSTKDGKVYQARVDYDQMCEQYEQSRDNYSATEQGHIDHEFLLLESTLSTYEGKVLSEDLCIQLSNNIARIDPTDHVTLGHHLALLCVNHAQRGLLKKAQNYAEQAIVEFKHFQSIYGEIYVNYHLGDISFAGGKSDDAERFYQTGLNLTRRHFNDDKSMKLVANVLIAELKYEMNQDNKLPSSIETIPKRLEEHEAWFDIYAAGYVTASNIEYQRYGLDAALRVLDLASAYAEEQKLDHLTNLITLQRVTLLLRAGLNDKASKTFKKSSIQLKIYSNTEASDIAWRERDAAVQAIIRLQICNKPHTKVVESLERFSAYAKAQGQVASYIRYKILQCIASHRLHKSEDAQLQIHQALSLSCTSGFIRSFLDEQEELSGILNNYLELSLKEPDEQKNKVHAAEILKTFSGNNTLSESDELLTKREQEILEHLSNACSNKVIARNINISGNTVRFHLKNLFAKLHVSNRLQAVSEARKRNMLELPKTASVS